MDKPSASKVVTAAELKSRLDRLRDGKAIVFTNGCFDLLHPGHVHGLLQARKLGDFLIVGINSDTSARRLKGAGRPILEQDERALMLSALECVDAVVIFEEDTPVPLIEALRPDIHVKGGDYADRDMPERAVVESYGGQVRFIELKPGWSTTGLIERLGKASPREIP